MFSVAARVTVFLGGMLAIWICCRDTEQREVEVGLGVVNFRVWRENFVGYTRNSTDNTRDCQRQSSGHVLCHFLSQPTTRHYHSSPILLLCKSLSFLLIRKMADTVVGIIGMGDMGKMYARRLCDAGYR